MKLLTFGTDESKIRYLSQPYTNIGKTYRDTFSKLEALSTLCFEDDEIVCFVDGYDVIQFGALEEVEQKFKTFQCDLVVGSETYCWPSPWMAHLFPITSTKYKYPNSGMYIGYWWAIKKMLSWDQYRLAFDDQGYFHDFFLNQKLINCKQDYDCVIFQNCVYVPLTDFEYKGDRVVNRQKGTEPCFFHFSGKSYMTRDGQNIMDLLKKKTPLDQIQQLPGIIEGL